MTAPTAEALAETLGETLEEAAFVFAEATDEPPPFGPEVLEARIGYEGPHVGELRLVADARLAGTLAANLLGEEEGAATSARAADALGELLNMIVGAWVVRLFGESARCKLGVPTVTARTGAEAAAALGPGPCAHLVEEEGRRIDLSLAVTAGSGTP